MLTMTKSKLIQEFISLSRNKLNLASMDRPLHQSKLDSSLKVSKIVRHSGIK